MQEKDKKKEKLTVRIELTGILKERFEELKKLYGETTNIGLVKLLIIERYEKIKQEKNKVSGVVSHSKDHLVLKKGDKDAARFNLDVVDENELNQALKIPEIRKMLQENGYHIKIEKNKNP